MIKEQYTPSNIFSDSITPVQTLSIKIKAGETCDILSPVYYDSTSKTFYTTAKGGTLGADKVFGLSTGTIVAGETDMDMPVYVTGDFNKNSIVLQSGENIDDYLVPLRKIGIFIK